MLFQSKSAAGRVVDKVLDSVLPRHCILCGLASKRANLCAPCSADLPRPRPLCVRCGLPLASEHDSVCGACLCKPPAWDRAVAALAYRLPVDYLVCHFKFSRNLACGEILATALVAAVTESVSALPDGIIPVPLHRTRLIYRTFNQAELLAKSVGNHLGLPVYTGYLNRVRRTQAQSGLKAAERRKNLRNAFEFRRGKGTALSGTHIALVDDVCTTGETLAACTQVLRRAGMKEVSIWVAARAPPP